MNKSSFRVLILVGILVAIAMILTIYYVATGGSLDTEDVINKSKPELLKPEIVLDYEPKENTSGKIIIYIEAYMEDGSEIESIVLPNSQEVISSTTKYEVSKNGTYEFIAKAVNGETVSQTIEINNILDSSSDKPYIPKGFEHVEGTEVDTGYVIKDKSGNEFVWVPVQTGKLTRNTEGSNQYVEYLEEISAFSNSVSRYYGFYISKYEASQSDDGENVICQKGYIPWSNITFSSAYEKAKNMGIKNGYEDVSTSLTNSYAWDTTLKWIDSSITNYSTNVSYGNYTGTILTTGAMESDIVNNINDISGNLREWTTEVYYPELLNEDFSEQSKVYRVIRGGGANMQKNASSHIGHPENMSDTFWGFRVILYKN